MDPAGQFWSPYNGMGNNPINGIDPDGRFSKFGAWWRSGFIPNSNYFEVSPGEWAVGWDEWRSDPNVGVYLFRIAIIENGPGITGNYKFNLTTEADISYKVGFNNTNDLGLVGLSIDGGSLEVLKGSVDPQRYSTFPVDYWEDDASWQQGAQRILKIESPNNFTQGIRIETPWFDFKTKINYDPTTLNFKNFEIGGGAPWLEAKIKFDHKGFHSLRAGTQEDIGGSINGHSMTASYFGGLTLKRKD